MQDFDKMRSSSFRILDPNDPYTLEDFNKEFGQIQPDQPLSESFYKLKLNFINNSNNQDPVYEKEGDSGFDLRANLDSDITLFIGRTILVPTGIHINLERGYEAQVRSRSGLAAKNNVFVLNSPGTIDYQYTAEIKVILTNLGEQDFVIQNGMRIAQVVISPVYSEHVISLTKVTGFNTDKNRGGFGSTGTK